jgi:hypothetical protein
MARPGRFVARTLMLVAALFASRAGAAESAVQPPGEQCVLALAKVYGAVRYFYPGDAVSRVRWDAFLVHAAGDALTVTRTEQIGPLLRKQFAMVAPDLEISAGRLAPVAATLYSHPVEWLHTGLGDGQIGPGNVYRSWRLGRQSPPAEFFPELATVRRDHADPLVSLELGAGWRARMPVALPSARALVTTSQDASLSKAWDEPVPWDPQAPTVDRAQALAAGIALWSAARHFYPYWTDVAVDWERTLRDWIAAQPQTQTRQELLRALRRLAAKMDDGHAGISDTARASPRQYLPIAVRPMGGTYVVTASAVPEVAAGDEIESIGGRSVADVSRELMDRASGGPTAKPWAVRYELLGGEPGATAEVRLRRGAESKNVRLSYSVAAWPEERRPEPIAELEPGTWYVDLSRFRAADFASRLGDVGKGKAIVFDMRGYPSGDGRLVVPYWVGKAEDVKWMQVPVFARPFAGPVAFRELGWSIKPSAGLESLHKILLIDARAVSYSESLVGYFTAHARGVTVGEPTAGANGNVSAIELPGGFTFRFTGMVVTTHDGSRIHARGFAPDVAISPTVAGIRAGRDEVLERAIEIAKARTDAGGR